MSLVFETQRLLLKPILKSELDRLHNILIDPYVRKYLCDDKIFSWQQTEAMLLENQRLFKEKKLGLWLIETKNNQEVIGFVGLWDFFSEAQPQLAYALIPTATKKGYATEAATKIIEYCFNELGYKYLIASSDQPNLESHRVAERLGMKKIEEKIINNNPILFFKIEKEQ
ncbi:GCN5-related N-acetyltransferase [Stanieria cyanosphaera PCC 7437]|uniref:GCN5-related N-acetyltransferase n=1 Tax=Stanieria cyanosphaera (strain ATCC 29371 / PCC 7437) TaxID=111780 RepID=K9XR65_STAC7|nr:GNAT family N-acetyltransferase [Stanieria cyanosphaera]AFZ34157.1 GCN5-related N-acetyltransferase [Stanieria cyanosphaera PCC 7437]